MQNCQKSDRFRYIHGLGLPAPEATHFSGHFVAGLQPSEKVYKHVGEAFQSSRSLTAFQVLVHYMSRNKYSSCLVLEDKQLFCKIQLRF